MEYERNEILLVMCKPHSSATAILTSFKHTCMFLLSIKACSINSCSIHTLTTQDYMGEGALAVRL